MASKILKRFLSLLLTLLLVSLFVFVSIELSQGDSSAVVLSDEATEAQIAEYRASMGLEVPFPLRYLQFLGSFLTLRWGKTLSGQSVKSVLAQRLPVTLALTFWAILFSFVFSLFMALKAAQKKGGKVDHLLSFLSFLFLVLPSFLSSLLLVVVFSFGLKLFPVAGYLPLKDGIIPHIRTLFLPSLTLAILHASLMMRLFREALEENLQMPFSRTALAKGMKEKQVPFRAALKPSLALMLSILGESLASGLGGAVVVENVFALPGIGSLLVQSALSRDASTAGILLLVVALMISLVFFLVDMLGFWIDPRLGRNHE